MRKELSDSSLNIPNKTPSELILEVGIPEWTIALCQKMGTFCESRRKK
jgi:hypothetical protein